MKKWFRCDWRIVWELGGLVALSAFLTMAGIYVFGSLEFEEIPPPALMPLDQLSILSSSSSPDTTLPSTNSLPERSSHQAQTRSVDTGSTIKAIRPQSQQAYPRQIETLNAFSPNDTAMADRPVPTPLAAPSVERGPMEDTDVDPQLTDLQEDEETMGDEEPSLIEGGDLVIAGMVLNQNGEPVPGVNVMALPYRLFTQEGGGEASTLDKRTQTNEYGFYEFDHLQDGEFQVRAEPSGPYQSASKAVRAGMNDVILVVTEARSHQVAGFVKHAETGQPLGGITITASAQTGSTDEAGYYQLSVPYQTTGQAPTVLRFSHQDYHEHHLTVPRQKTYLGNPITLKGVALRPVQGIASVQGTVESQLEGTPLVNIPVFLSPVTGHGQLNTLTDHEGTFHFPKVATGRYKLVVAPKEGHKDFQQEKLEVGEGGVESLRVQLEPTSTSVLRGQIVDPIGQPISGLTLWLKSRTVRTFAGKPVTSDPSGFFEVHDVPEGELQLVTHSEPHLQINGITLQPGEFQTGQLKIDWGTQILHGRVVDAGTLPVAGATVTLVWLHESHGVKSRGIRHTSADETGSFRFNQLGRGIHTLNVSAPGFHRKLMEHDVGPDQLTVLVTLPSVSP